MTTDVAVVTLQVCLLFSITIMSCLLLVNVTGSGVAVPFVAVLLIVPHFVVDVGVTFDVDAGFCGVASFVTMTCDAGVVINCDVM